MSEYHVIGATSAFLATAIIVLTIWTILNLKTALTNFLRERLLSFFARTKKYFGEKPLCLIPVGVVTVLLLLCFIQMTMISPTIDMKVRYCSLHHCSTLLTLCPISYGLIDVHNDDGLARESLFPLSNSRIRGGCEDGRDGRYKWIMYCPDCRLAEFLWQKRSQVNRF